MTELEWLSSTKPNEMLAFVKERTDPRKLRLFAAACIRTCWGYLNEEASRNAVEIAEQFADGLVPAEILPIARKKALDAREGHAVFDKTAHAAVHTLEADAFLAAS